MKIHLLFTLCLIGAVTSCSSQNRTDLLAMSFGQSITELITAKKLNASQDVNYGIYSYETDKLEVFKIGDIKLSTYKYPNSALADYNDIQVYVDNRELKNYLGFRYTTVKQDEIQSLIAYLKNRYAVTVHRKDSAGDVYFWDIEALDAWLFYYPSISIDGNGDEFLQSDFVFVKKGTRVENSEDTSVFTIWELVEAMYP